MKVWPVMECRGGRILLSGLLVLAAPPSCLLESKSPAEQSINVVRDLMCSVSTLLVFLSVKPSFRFD
ncbi:hypothetical protein E2C01_091213 [Portunus trituberculatus]|uniref:Secreted protein n=1 Tax=Portunus trituberculatus TaxID=210409 RepID=A0A5B7JGZ2_PORTR|nr:hypothetical protein [Portunus trituberculatus]